MGLSCRVALCRGTLKVVKYCRINGKHLDTPSQVPSLARQHPTPSPLHTEGLAGGLVGRHVLTVHSQRSTTNTPHFLLFIHKLNKKITCDLCFIYTSKAHLIRGGVAVTLVGVRCGCTTGLGTHTGGEP
ncbi:hypothetical protein E2C01_032953 [Portunus trituberculatus]|uniref:Uncharacterized protein n=1 Tax=Portunus trituberculatus TaxID=210409 RepID=A0A5B7F1Q3_PORTR|nr:hypothetical protein [Portunus trituberculatus]